MEFNSSSRPAASIGERKLNAWYSAKTAYFVRGSEGLLQIGSTPAVRHRTSSIERKIRDALATPQPFLSHSDERVTNLLIEFRAGSDQMCDALRFFHNANHERVKVASVPRRVVRPLFDFVE